jgi:hypothetical protein
VTIQDKNRPVLARDIYEKYVSDKGEIDWPEDSKERELLARALYGKELISTFDYWFSHAVDLIENPRPSKSFPRKNDAYKQDKYIRDGFSTLSLEQKQVVRDLVRRIVHGVLFGVLVDLDQSHYGEYELSLKPQRVEGNDQTIKITLDKPEELHDELNDWVLSFSKFADEIAELIEVKGGWEISLKAFYNV